MAVVSASDRLSLSDVEDEEGEDHSAPSFRGTLNKWTNYIHGWQTRYFVLQDGAMSYYKSELDTTFGCRGAISISKASVQAHEFDECRFDVSVNDCVWYLRAETLEERQSWIDALEAYKADSGYGSQGDLRRHGSMLSLTPSLTSGSSIKRGSGLKEKSEEMETFRDILCRQIDTLQSYFDYCAHTVPPASIYHDDTNESDESADRLSDDQMSTNSKDSVGSIDKNSNQTHRNVNGLKGENLGIDFRGEALTFKATTAGVLATLQHCIELMQQREEQFKRRLDKEIERRKRIQDAYHSMITEGQKTHKPVVVFGGPDFEEGPHSSLNEEEWHDAVDAALERQDKEDLRIQRFLSKDSAVVPPKSTKSQALVLPKKHPLYPTIDNMTMEQLHYALAGVEEGVWQLFAEDGEMKMFKREVEIDGLVCDPLKAAHTIKGVTGHEYCHYFFEPDYKLDWDTTLEQVDVLDRVADDTIVFHQIHKRVWPATQRESLFWSHLRRVPNIQDPDSHDVWIVCNHDTEHEKAPVTSKFVRVGLTVAMVCQTFITPPAEGKSISRDDITCKIMYVAQVNPGGWAPSSILRTVYKREYPKFLKRFTQFVVQKCEGKPIMF